MLRDPLLHELDLPPVLDVPSAHLHQLQRHRCMSAHYAEQADGAIEHTAWRCRHCVSWSVLMRVLRPAGKMVLDPESVLAEGDCSADAAILMARMAETLAAQAAWHLAGKNAAAGKAQFSSYQDALGHRQRVWLMALPAGSAAAWRQSVQLKHREI